MELSNICWICYKSIEIPRELDKYWSSIVNCSHFNSLLSFIICCPFYCVLFCCHQSIAFQTSTINNWKREVSQSFFILYPTSWIPPFLCPLLLFIFKGMLQFCLLQCLMFSGVSICKWPSKARGLGLESVVTVKKHMLFFTHPFPTFFVATSNAFVEQ